MFVNSQNLFMFLNHTPMYHCYLFTNQLNGFKGTVIPPFVPFCLPKNRTTKYISPDKSITHSKIFIMGRSPSEIQKDIEDAKVNLDVKKAEKRLKELNREFDNAAAEKKRDEDKRKEVEKKKEAEKRREEEKKNQAQKQMAQKQMAQKKEAERKREAENESKNTKKGNWSFGWIKNNDGGPGRAPKQPQANKAAHQQPRHTNNAKVPFDNRKKNTKDAKLEAAERLVTQTMRGVDEVKAKFGKKGASERDYDRYTEAIAKERRAVASLHDIKAALEKEEKEEERKLVERAEKAKKEEITKKEEQDKKRRR